MVFIQQKNRKDTIMEAKWELPPEDEERKIIYEWSEKRRRTFHGLKKSYNQFLVYTFNLNTLISFLKNFNFMVLIQMTLAGVIVYVFKRFDISFDTHVGLFVSPIVFPLAFSINTDFQRREKVLDDLANFKSASMIWFFCMRDWKEAAELDDEWLKTVHLKLKSMLFHLREYLLTERLDRRKVILRAMYEDFSDTNQLIEKVRTSKLPANSAVISRVIHLLNMLCLSFERLRNVREYRSPRSIRSFNKVLIFFLPFILAPYFVYLGKKIDNEWSPYYISILVAFVFSALQGVQDKLDDPFDGMSEDDINLTTIDEWTFNSLGATVNRSFKVGRFKVMANIEVSDMKPRSSTALPRSVENTDGVNAKRSLQDREGRFSSRSVGRSKRISSKGNLKQRGLSFFDRNHSLSGSTKKKQILHLKEPSLDMHPYVDLLEKIQGDVPIRRRGHVTPINENLSSSATLTSINGLFKNALQDKNLSNETAIDIESLKQTPIDSPTNPSLNPVTDNNKQNQIFDNIKKLQLTLDRIDSGVVMPSDKEARKSLSNTSLHTYPLQQFETPLIQKQTPSNKESRFKLTNIGGHVKSSSSKSSNVSVSGTTTKESVRSGRFSLQSNDGMDSLSYKEDEVFI